MARPVRMSAVALLVASLAACAPGASDVVERGSSGVLRGTVRLAGTYLPDQPLVENATDPGVCGRLMRTDELSVDAPTRGIAHAIVALRGVEPAEPPTPSRLVLHNRDCQFVPRAAVLTVGSTLEAVSHDDVLHTVHLYGASERNLALPDPSATMTVTLDTPGMIAVLCDVHGWMKAYIRVDTHPFHAVTDAEGTFAIANVPAGSYELEVWHERLGTQIVPVRVGAEAGVALDIEYVLDNR